MMMLNMLGLSVLAIAGVLGLRALGRSGARQRRGEIRGIPRSVRIPLALLALGSAIGAPVLMMQTAAGQAARNQRLGEELARAGVSATATVNHFEGTGTFYNHRPEMNLWLTVRPEGGAAFDAEASWAFSIKDAQDYRVGAKVRVRFDPEDRQRVAVVGLAVARAVQG
jgi:hypothetical protein